MERPRHVYELTLHVRGATWDAVTRELEETTTHVIEHGPECREVSGDTRASHRVEVQHDPAMSEERYAAQLTQYVAHLYAERGDTK